MGLTSSSTLRFIALLASQPNDPGTRLLDPATQPIDHGQLARFIRTGHSPPLSRSARFRRNATFILRTAMQWIFERQSGRGCQTFHKSALSLRHSVAKGEAV